MTSKELSDLRRDFDRLRSDLHQLRADLGGVSEDSLRAARAGAAAAKERVDRGVRAAADKGRESVEAVEEQVAAHPFMALASALAVGMVIGFAASRRN